MADDDVYILDEKTLRDAIWSGLIGLIPASTPEKQDDLTNSATDCIIERIRIAQKEKKEELI